jgi:glycosyltransferase involved in cell wall biosynthesis
MRILYVTAEVPWPLTSGYLRHYHFLRALGERHAVTLLSLRGPSRSDEDVDALRPIVERIVTEPAARGRRPLRVKVADRLRVLASGGDPAAARLGRAGAALAADAPFDVLLMSGRRTMPVMSELPPMPMVADLCDAASNRIRGQMRDAGPLQLPPLALEYLEVRRVETALLRRARHALFASPRDRAAVVGRTDDGSGTPTSIVPNGVDLAFWERTSAAYGRDEIVLTGAMDYPPNEDAAVMLVERVLPPVRAVAPTAHVSIVGRDPTPRVRALADRPGVTVTGYVDDVRPYLDAAAVFAAPLRHGAGIQNKVLEALAMDVPVVATPLAAAGLQTEAGDRPPIDVADIDAMAERIVERLRRASAGDAPDGSRRAYIERHFDWGRNADRLEHILLDASGPGPRGAGI